MNLPSISAAGSARVIGVIGGGAAGALVLAALHRAGLPAGTAVLVFDERAELGAGVAYSTTCPDHLLNVPACGLGVLEPEPDGFVGWLRANGSPGARPGDFVPRRDFGRYLADVLRTGADRVRHVRDRVVGLRPEAGGLRLRLAGGGSVRVDEAVLACGNVGWNTAWAPPGLLRSARFVADPWPVLDSLRGGPARSVLLVGTGLTMVDVALALGPSGVSMTAVSPGGRPPTAHAEIPRPPLEPPAELARCTDPATLVRLVGEHVRRARDEHGDWRPAIDGLRPITAELWRRIPVDRRGELLREHRSWWNRRRHRMAPRVARSFELLRTDGRLDVRAGRIEAVTETRSGLRVEFVDGSRCTVDVVVNCTGTEPDLRRVDDPLIRDLLGAGLVRPGPLGLGLDTRDGRLVAATGRVLRGVHTLGATRVGELWETTAVPEIRRQAADLAGALAAALTGNPVLTG